MNKTIAIQFIEHFCEGNIEQLALLLSSELCFRGPLYQFNNADEYIATKVDPAEVAQSFDFGSVKEVHQVEEI